MTRPLARLRIVIPSLLRGLADRIDGRRCAPTVMPENRNADWALLERQKVALARTAGILKNAENPDWETPEKTSAWVRKLRYADNSPSEDKLTSPPLHDASPARL